MSSITSLKKQIEISARGLEVKQAHYDSLKKELSGETAESERKIWVIAAGALFVGGFIYGASPRARHFVKKQSKDAARQLLSSGLALSYLKMLVTAL